MTLTDSATIFHRGQGDGPATARSSDSTCYDPRADRTRTVSAAPLVAVRAETEAQIMAVLAAPAHPGETVSSQFQRKEHQLGSIFAALSLAEARALHRRLAIPQAGDALALKFARMVVDRKNRLLAFLADAPRRAAIGGAR